MFLRLSHFGQPTTSEAILIMTQRKGVILIEVSFDILHKNQVSPLQKFAEVNTTSSLQLGSLRLLLIGFHTPSLLIIWGCPWHGRRANHVRDLV